MHENTIIIIIIILKNKNKNVKRQDHERSERTRKG